jgi:hypothetical protein
LTGDSNWTADGDITISNSLGASVSITRNSSQWYDTGYQLLSEFSYQRTEYYNLCAGYAPYYLVEATQWDGGISVGANVGGNDGHPNQYTDWFPPGSTFTRTQGSAWRYNVAVTTPWGASLTAQSGYSQYVELHWSFASSAGYDQALYGNNNYPPYSQIIYAYLRLLRKETDRADKGRMVDAGRSRRVAHAGGGSLLATPVLRVALRALGQYGGE